MTSAKDGVRSGDFSLAELVAHEERTQALSTALASAGTTVTDHDPKSPAAIEGLERAFASVAVPVPLHDAFIYRVPADLAARVRPGVRVAVPFGRRKVLGLVVATDLSAPPALTRIRSITAVIDERPVFEEELLRFLEEAARYYLHPLGEVLRAASPAIPSEAVARLKRSGFVVRGDRALGSVVAPEHDKCVRLTAEGRAALAPTPPRRLGKVQRELCDALLSEGTLTVAALRGRVPRMPPALRRLRAMGWVEIVEAVSTEDCVAAALPKEPLPTLTKEQARAVQRLTSVWETAARRPMACLLQGVTGSGKTEVYMRAIARALEQDMGALVLVPEIALTPQLVARFRARFGEALAVLHSGLSDRQRYHAWSALREGRLRLAIGARSALFAPVRKLGVVVVDEEHDASFKQETGFRYHARDMALLRAHRAGALCILGSATPSFESRHGVEQGRLAHVLLTERAMGQPLPEVEIVDLNRHREGPTKHALISAPLYRGLAACLDRKEQAILFLNRRGFSPAVRCGACGTLAGCPACSVAMTEHRAARQLQCHYCDHTEAADRPCTACGATEPVALGLGTEQLEEAIGEAFAGVRVARLDRDTATLRTMERILRRFRAREVDVLVGTQMVTKGHDLPGVTLVGVILADQSMAFPDFRAGERTFQLLSQVAGRAGRADLPGRVLFQTFQPHHPAVRCAATHDYEGFFAHEMASRQDLLYPPFAYLNAIRLEAGDEAQARAAGAELRSVAQSDPLVAQGEVLVLGPAPAPVARVRGRYRYRLLLRSRNRKSLRRVTRRLHARIQEGLGAARAVVDVDPVAMM